MLQLGTSPLHLAAQYGHYSTTEVLLRAGVSRDARTKVDRTPLHMAASEGHASIVEVLLKVKNVETRSDTWILQQFMIKYLQFPFSHENNIGMIHIYTCALELCFPVKL